MFEKSFDHIQKTIASLAQEIEEEETFTEELVLQTAIRLFRTRKNMDINELETQTLFLLYTFFFFYNQEVKIEKRGGTIVFSDKNGKTVKTSKTSFRDFDAFTNEEIISLAIKTGLMVKFLAFPLCLAEEEIQNHQLVFEALPIFFEEWNKNFFERNL